MDPSRRSELERQLAAADRYIAEAEGRIARQSEVVVRLDIGGHDTTLALRQLRTMEAALDTVREHRRRIERELAGGEPPAG